jgi:asparagine synthase (glutamine-hydrolysing)
MCGINGFIRNTDSNSVDLIECIKLMNSEIIHRGPNDSGLFVSPNGKLALGMQRLSIIDLNSGGQPMYSSDKKIVIVFNGEIYNFLDLRQELISFHDVSFSTNSDTEVILKGYEIFGVDYFSNINGMFSIAIYDRRINKLIIVRDRTGEKPLYYWSKNGYFVFCSELKSLKKFWNLHSIDKPSISQIALNLYLSLTYIPSPYSIYEGVLKLEPGCYLEIETESLSFEIKQFWNILPLEKETITNYSLAKSMLKDLVYDSVDKRMISDVPYGAFLSGGVDSSIIVSVMADLKPNEVIKTFSIISNNKNFDESERSYSVAKHCKTEHYPIVLDLNDIQENINSVILNYDEPFADSSALPSYFVSKVTKEKVTVALTGDGGDEVFGGYNRYKMAHYSNLYNKFIPGFLHDNIIKPLVSQHQLKRDSRGFIFKAKKFVNAFSDSEYDNLINIMSLGFERKSLNEYLKLEWRTDKDKDFFADYYSKIDKLTSLQKSRYLDLKICLEGDMLTKVDRASMMSSLECRPPFLDHRLIEFSYQLPDNFLISKGVTKKILKETFEDMLPKGLFSLSKSGFGVPIGDWLRDNLKIELIELSTTDILESQGIFCVHEIQTLVNNHIKGISDNTFKVWTFYCFQKWYINDINN